MLSAHFYFKKEKEKKKNTTLNSIKPIRLKSHNYLFLNFNLTK
jgi:hypothetical protein